MPVRSSRKKQPGRPVATECGATAARLLDCALTLFAEKGYLAASTNEIIAAAGVSKPVLYHHFESKEGLFRRLVGDLYTAGEVAWDEIIRSVRSCPERLREMIRGPFHACAADPRVPRLLLQTHYGPPVAELRSFMEHHTSRRFAQVVRVMQDGLDDGEIQGGDASSLALVFCCLMDQHVQALARLNGNLIPLGDERAGALVELLFSGCGTGKRGLVKLPPLFG